MNIAVIFTCYNRKKMTLNCIEKLMTQSSPDIKLEFYICDDASSDGTYEAVKAKYPEVCIFQSIGNLFWCKGMYIAMKEAVKTYHDYYMMVNDDVDFDTNAIYTMLTPFRWAGDNCAVVGSVRSSIDGHITYGGRKIIPYKLWNFSFGIKSNMLLTPNSNPPYTECQLTNWNCFMVTREIINNVGLIDNHYEHGMGDYDYSLRVIRKGYKIYIAPKSVGECETNSRKNSFMDRNTPRRVRVKKLLSPKGMPIKSTYRNAFRQNNILGLLIATWRYIQFFKCIFLNKDIG